MFATALAVFFCRPETAKAVGDTLFGSPPR